MKFLTPLLLITCIAPAAYGASLNDLQRLAPQQEKAVSGPLTEERRQELIKTAMLPFCCQDSKSWERLFYPGGPWDKPGNYTKKCGVNMARCGCSLTGTCCCLGCISATVALAGCGMSLYAFVATTSSASGCTPATCTVAKIGGGMFVGSGLLLMCLPCSFARHTGTPDDPSCTERCDSNILDRLSNPDNWSQEGSEEKASLLSNPTETREPREEI